MQLKCCTQYVSKFGKLSGGHWTGKSRFSFQSQRRAMPKNFQTTVALISHASEVKLARECPDVQAGFKKAEELEFKLPTFTRR